MASAKVVRPVIAPEPAPTSSATGPIDVGNLSLFSTKPVDAEKFRAAPQQYLKDISTESAQALIAAVFALPSEKIPQGRVAVLPAPTTHIPREKPIPKPRAPTAWESFAKMKGIQKKKKSRMTWDEEKNEYRPSWGYKRAGDKSDEWVIEESGNTEDPTVDPWTRLASEKKARVDKNETQRLKNLRAAEGDRLPGTVDLSSAFDKKKAKRNKVGKEDTKHHVDIALAAVQKSTASMGKFDVKRKTEPTAKAAPKPKRDADFQKNIKLEKEQNMKVLDKLMGSDEGSSFNATAAVNQNQARTEASNKRSASKAKSKRQAPKKRKVK